MKKPELTTQEPALDWNNAVAYIEEKYKIDIRNYAGKTYDPKDPNYDKPYQDFWHWFSERYDVTSESYTQVYFGENLEVGDMEEWQKEIAKLFVNEFGKEFRVWIEW